MLSASVKQAASAFDALRSYYSTVDSNSGTLALFDDDSKTVNLALVLKKVPTTIVTQKYATIQLPYPARQRKTTSVCLFVKDLDREKFDQEVDKSSKLFKDYLIFERGLKDLNEVIALRQLKRQYKTYQDKRKLCSAYDVFLVDSRVAVQVSRNLGKSFHEHKKLPISISMEGSNLNKKIDKLIASTSFTLKPTSTRCSINIGTLNQSNDELCSNVKVILGHMKTKLPGGLDNLRSVHVVLSQGKPSLPIYVSTESSNNVKMAPPKKHALDPVLDELDTLFDESDTEADDNVVGNRVKVYPETGRIAVFGSKDKDKTVSKRRVKKIGKVKKIPKRLQKKRTVKTKLSKVKKLSTKVENA